MDAKVISYFGMISLEFFFQFSKINDNVNELSGLTKQIEIDFSPISDFF